MNGECSYNKKTPKKKTKKKHTPKKNTPNKKQHKETQNHTRNWEAYHTLIRCVQLEKKIWGRTGAGKNYFDERERLIRRGESWPL